MNNVLTMMLNDMFSRVNTLHTDGAIGFIMIQNRLVSQNTQNFTHFKLNSRHVCTYLNVFPVVIQNIVMKFNYLVIFWTFCELLDLSSAHACRAQNVNIET